MEMATSEGRIFEEVIPLEKGMLVSGRLHRLWRERGIEEYL